MKTEKKSYCKPSVVVVALPDALMGDGSLTIASKAKDSSGAQYVAPFPRIEEEEEQEDSPWGN